MENYKPNSYKYKEEQKAKAEQKKVQKVVSGPVTTRKKTGLKKFIGSFVTEDAPKIKEFILIDVIVPSIKRAISDTIDMALYGESRSRKSSTSGSRVSYRDYYNRRDRDERPRASRSAFDYEDPLFNNRGDAEMVLSQMEDIIERYGFAKIADLYDLAGITITNYCANNYGWTDLHSARVVRESDGYIIELPKAMPID